MEKPLFHIRSEKIIQNAEKYNCERREARRRGARGRCKARQMHARTERKPAKTKEKENARRAHAHRRDAKYKIEAVAEHGGALNGAQRKYSSIYSYTSGAVRRRNVPTRAKRVPVKRKHALYIERVF